MRRRSSRWLRWLLGVLGALLLIVLSAAGYVTWKLRASLPELDGEVKLSGLAASVTVERDELGVPTLRGGASRADLARATGFLHAQDRFFQMDLLRRSGAGELAALFGPAVIEQDRAVRIHRFRARAAEAVRAQGPEARALLEAYVDGVNSGLAALGAMPPEYLLLRTAPEPWRAEDTVLVVFAMFLDLQGGTCSHEAQRGVLFETLPAELAAFLAPPGTGWDAPVRGEAEETPPIPPLPPSSDSARGIDPAEPALDLPGSNNWAVAGNHTAHGAAILANDMHLGLSLPNIWYRLSLVLPDADGRTITGVTLPGTPAIVVGSNGHVAWGFTNSYGDWCDLVLLETTGEDAASYLTPDGPRAFEHFTERIEVRGKAAVDLDVAETVWGPVVAPDRRGRPRALRWAAHEPGAADLDMLRLERVSTVAEALDVAATSGIPGQNFVAADSTGSIGWTIMGRIPRRSAPPPSVPVSWRDAGTWDGWLDPGSCPRIVDPPDGRIWTANNRVIDAAGLADLGDGGFDLGARARQIRDDLFAVERAEEQDMLGVQTDDRALFLSRWRDLLLGLLDATASNSNPRRIELSEAVDRGWSGRASIDSVGYRVVRAFRIEVAERVIGRATAAAKASDDDFSFWRTSNQIEGPLWRLVEERPAALLDPAYASWDEWLLSAADAAVDRLLDAPDKKLRDRTWGERNTVRIGHPLSLAVPALARWLDLPPEPLPGDSSMPRVQSPRFGASERLVVAPGHEERGIFHMPGGQSGHPLSPYYRKGHEAWAAGSAAPFLPGPMVHGLVLAPVD